MNDYLLSVVQSQKNELRQFMQLYQSEISLLRSSLAASQAECAALRHQLAKTDNSFNSTLGSSSDSPLVSSPFVRPQAPSPEDWTL